MESKIARIWDDAINRLEKAQEHLAKGEFELTKIEAKNAATSGQISIILVLRGREDDRKAAEVGIDPDLYEDWDKTCSLPQDYIAKAKKLLKRFSHLSPPENKLPFE